MDGDKCAFLFIRAEHLVGSYLGSVVHLKPSARATAPDRLTVPATTLSHWLRKPSEDSDLSFLLLKLVITTVNKYPYQLS